MPLFRLRRCKAMRRGAIRGQLAKNRPLVQLNPTISLQIMRKNLVNVLGPVKPQPQQRSGACYDSLPPVRSVDGSALPWRGCVRSRRFSRWCLTTFFPPR